MMKKIYFLLFVLFGLNVQAQIVNIPDANFKGKLLAANPSNTIASATPIYNSNTGFWNVTNYNTIDINGDGEIQLSEAQNIKYLKLNHNINDLTGIEAFTNLVYLNCSVNNITSLNVTALTYLDQLLCNNNDLTNLNVSGLTNLKKIACNNNNLTNLNLTGLTNLKSLYCQYNNLTNLNLTGLSNLEELYCEENDLISLNLSGLTNLKRLHCYFNNLTSLDASNLTNLNYLYCYNNLNLTNLNLSGLTNLLELDCKNNHSINDLNNLISSLPNLKKLNCRNCSLNSLDVSSLINLDDLNCDANNMTFLNIKNNNPFWSSNNSLSFYNNTSLQYICADEDDVNFVNQIVTAYGYNNCNVNSYCSFTPNGIFYEIQGSTFFDNDGNGCDVNDLVFDKLGFSINNGSNVSYSIGNQTGSYYIPVGNGNFTITPNLENPTYFNINPTSFVANFPTQTSPLVQDFCVTTNGVHHDVEVVVLPTVPARPGFDAKYKISYRNKGNQVENGSVSLTFDDAVLDYISSNPVFESQIVNTFTWNYSNLQPFETREIEVFFNVNSPMETPAVSIDDVLNYTATIATSNTDETPDDNEFTLNQIVVGSYDPNDKTCLEGETVGPNMIGEYVHYLIRFENTGTYPAENVVVKDMIDLTKFDLATLIPLKGSHDFYTRIKDNKVEFIFENINLDFNDTTNDGYVAFKIKTKQTLALGDTFSNNANIYFDYNFPITTNTYTTTFQALSIQDFDFSSKFTLYPNPVQDVLHFNSKENITIQSVEIYNMLGQVVLTVPNATKSVDVSNLTKGNYFVKVNTEKGSSNTKFVKK
ncbi:T9SS type A sorting domain-containing protein [Flavobacterium sediminilitoris]|uniref:T9SS type A sorting domain-containing protein n=1 Tax=Flavobacterium sediminilitoris TaxID=2024526 RepID=A0ABY4HP60_9FLAO|nr:MULTISPECIES: T9SS type A sorting domain-containing protein [Flavobacterium]UOX33309.1 T9SS type A sorting domain-containing protein [Flavobacterium sediminilitoris]